MGNGPSNRRQSAPLPRLFPHPPGYPGARPSPSPPTIPPYFYPTNFSSHFYSHTYSPNNAPYLMSLPPPGFRLSGSHSSPPRVPVTEHQKARTIQNDVNVKKTTLKLVKDEQNPGFYLVSFAFDATVPGSISIFFLAKEGPNCTLTTLKPDLFRPVRVPFEKGLGQNFSQASGTGVNLSLYSTEELLKDGQDEIYTLIIRTETLPKNDPTDSAPRNNVTIGGPLPKWVNSQTTHATIESKDDGEYYPKVLKQIIWVDGVRYELQEIYGIETNATESNFDGTDAGKECVICLSEPRDTTVLPCRHMCMCSECAKVLRFQTNRCPICRCVVEQLLEIKVPKTDSQDKVGCSSKSSSGC